MLSSFFKRTLGAVCVLPQQTNFSARASSARGARARGPALLRGLRLARGAAVAEPVALGRLGEADAGEVVHRVAAALGAVAAEDGRGGGHRALAAHAAALGGARRARPRLVAGRGLEPGAGDVPRLGAQVAAHERVAGIVVVVVVRVGAAAALGALVVVAVVVGIVVAVVAAAVVVVVVGLVVVIARVVVVVFVVVILGERRAASAGR